MKLMIGIQERSPSYSPKCVLFFYSILPISLWWTLPNKKQLSKELGNVVCRVPAPASASKVEWRVGLELRNSRDIKGPDAVDGIGGVSDERGVERS